MQGQLSLFEVFPKALPELALGKYNENLKDYLGRIIPIDQMKEYIGKKAILAIEYAYGVYYKVILIKGITEHNVFITDSGKIFDEYSKRYSKEELVNSAKSCTVAYSDSKNGETNSWAQEYWLKNGRIKDSRMNFYETIYAIA